MAEKKVINIVMEVSEDNNITLTSEDFGIVIEGNEVVDVLATFVDEVIDVYTDFADVELDSLENEDERHVKAFLDSIPIEPDIDYDEDYDYDEEETPEQ